MSDDYTTLAIECGDVRQRSQPSVRRNHGTPRTRTTSWTEAPGQLVAVGVSSTPPMICECGLEIVGVSRATLHLHLEAAEQQTASV